MQQTATVVLDFQRVSTTVISRDRRRSIDEEQTRWRPDACTHLPAHQLETMFIVSRLQQPHTRILFDINVADRSDIDLRARASISLQPLTNRESPVVRDLRSEEHTSDLQ